MSRAVPQSAEAGQDPWQFDPLELINFLRGRDFRLGVGDALRVVQLLQRLEEAGRAPCTLEQFARSLAPVLCTNARQQAILPERLRAFASEYQRRTVQPFGIDDGSTTDRPLDLPASWRRWFTRLVGIFIAIFIAVGIIRFVPFEGLFSSIVPSGETPLPGTPTSSTLEKGLVPQAALIKVGEVLPLGAVPPLLWLLFVRWRRRKVPALSRQPYDDLAPASLKVAGPPVVPFGGVNLSHALQGMRAHRRVASLMPDATATVHATIAASGYFTLVTGWRPRLPEYPILIEALSARDHVVALGRALSARLKDESVEHTLYFFESNLRQVRTENDRPATIADIAARFEQDVLIIVSDGEALYDPILGRLNPALPDVDAWRLIVLLTPVPRWRWSWRERRIAQAGLVVLPATPDGLRILGNFLRAEGRPPQPSLDRPPARPGPLVLEGRNARRWHSDIIPSEVEREAALDAIALELSSETFEFMCVLALFPELRPDLTLHAANFLKGPDGRPLVDDTSFAALAALPWFRLGRIPDWLRLDLALSLQPERKEEARQMFAAWLTANSAGGAGVQIAADHLGEVVSEDAKRSSQSAMRDVIFLRFCNREDLSDIDLQVPEEVAAALGVRAFTTERVLLAASLVLSIVSVVVGFQFPIPNRSNFVPPLVIALEACQLFGLGWGLWYALRRRPSSLGGYGFAPIIASIISALLATLILTASPPSDYSDVLVLLWLNVPCLAMAIVSARLFAWMPSPTTWFAHALSDLPALLSIVLAVLIADASWASSNDIIFLFSCALALYCIGVAGLYARHVALGTKSLIAHSIVATIAGLEVLLIVDEFMPSLIEKGQFSAAVVSLAATLPHLGCATAVSTTRGTKLGGPVTIWTVTVALLFGIIGLSATHSDGIFPVVSPYPWLLMVGIVQVAAVTIPFSISHPGRLRDPGVWIAAVTGSAVGAPIATFFIILGREPGQILDSLIGIGQLPWGFITLPATVAWIGARLDRLPYRVAFEKALSAYRPDLATAILILLWLLGLRITIGEFSLTLSAFYIPISAWIATRFGTAGLTLLLWGAAPLLVGLKFGNVSTVLDPGLFGACVLIYRLVAEPDLRARLASLQGLGLLLLIGVVLLGGAQLSIVLSDNFELGGSLGFLLGIVMVLLGVVGCRRRSVIAALCFAGAITIAPTLFDFVARQSGPLRLDYMVNPICLYLLFELGRQWVINLPPRKPVPRLMERMRMLWSEGFKVTLGLLIPTRRSIAAYAAFVTQFNNVSIAMNVIMSGIIFLFILETLFGIHDSAPGLSAPLIYFASLGRIYFDRSALNVLSRSAIFTAGLAGVAWFSVSFSPPQASLGGLLPFPFNLGIPQLAFTGFTSVPYFTEFALLLPVALSGAWLGWRLSRWTQEAGTDWRRKYGFQTLTRVSAPALAREAQIETDQQRRTRFGNGESLEPDALVKSLGASVVEVVYATDRKTIAAVDKDVAYGSEPSEELSFGICHVSVPQAHRLGRLELPSILRLQFAARASEHFTILRSEIISQGNLEATLRRTDHPLDSRTLLYVPGFNLNFAESVLRMGQIKWDLQSNSILYSWPSRGKLTGYLSDQESVRRSASNMTRLIAQLSRTLSGRLDFWADGLGGVLLLEALSQLAQRDASVRLGQIIFTKPDVDSFYFQHTAESIVKVAEMVTVFISRSDPALKISERLAGSAIAGRQLLGISGLNMIDISASDPGAVLMDIATLLKTRSPLDRRFGLRIPG